MKLPFGKKSNEQTQTQQPASAQNCDDLFASMENEVTDEDLDNCRKQLSRKDRIGKYSKWLCILCGGFAGVYIANLKTTSPWSRIPLVGQVYDIFFANPLTSIISMIIGGLVGLGLFWLIAQGIYSGGVQDQRNRGKME